MFPISHRLPFHIVLNLNLFCWCCCCCCLSSPRQGHRSRPRFSSSSCRDRSMRLLHLCLYGKCQIFYQTEDASRRQKDFGWACHDHLAVVGHSLLSRVSAFFCTRPFSPSRWRLRHSPSTRPPPTRCFFSCCWIQIHTIRFKMNPSSTCSIKTMTSGVILIWIRWSKTLNCISIACRPRLRPTLLMDAVQCREWWNNKWPGKWLVAFQQLCRKRDSGSAIDLSVISAANLITNGTYEKAISTTCTVHIFVQDNSFEWEWTSDIWRVN